MIGAAAWQGDPTSWQDIMLTVSHLGMAAEVLLFARCYSFSRTAILLVGIWTFWNDFMDYQKGIYPWLPDVLMDNLSVIECFTISLSIISLVISLLVYRSNKTN